MGDGADHRTWNVFRRRDAHGLCCAVSSDAPIPAFLMSGDWTFGFQFTRGDPPVSGFSAPSAEIGARYNGFYLFLGFGGRLATRRPPTFPVLPPCGGEPNDRFAHSPDMEPRPA